MKSKIIVGIVLLLNSHVIWPTRGQKRHVKRDCIPADSLEIWWRKQIKKKKINNDEILAMPDLLDLFKFSS
jgi:hypothetical protein